MPWGPALDKPGLDWATYLCCERLGLMSDDTWAHGNLTQPQPPMCPRVSLPNAMRVCAHMQGTGTRSSSASLPRPTLPSPTPRVPHLCFHQLVDAGEHAEEHSRIADHDGRHCQRRERHVALLGHLRRVLGAERVEQPLVLVLVGLWGGGMGWGEAGQTGGRENRGWSMSLRPQGTS